MTESKGDNENSRLDFSNSGSWSISRLAVEALDLILVELKDMD